MTPSRFGLHDWFSRTLGIDNERKTQIYIDLSISASLRDPAYWLEILFSCGIATLGLVLNSPAVIIGAMLISPLMGPILSGGLALAAGDLILGARAFVSILLSVFVALVFATLLVAILPFKEMTPEILARTEPNTLDLFIALFSGAIGSLAIVKPLKGVATSIPGVAIAVALMPPLCVVGYGTGLAITLSASEGWMVARGGGLLFLTNLVAITFMAMVIFLLLRISEPAASDAVRDWRESNPESRAIQNALSIVPITRRLRVIGGLPGRFFLIISFIALLAIPLTQSFTRMKREVARKQQQNRVQRAATTLWQENFAQFGDGRARSYIDAIATSEEGQKLAVDMRVITSRPYSEQEKTTFAQMIGAKLDRPAEAIELRMIEIPTSDVERVERPREAATVAAQPSIADMRLALLDRVSAEVAAARVAPEMKLAGHSFTSSPGGRTQLTVYYLSPLPIGNDAAAIIRGELVSRLRIPNLAVDVQHIPTAVPLAVQQTRGVWSVPADDRVDRAIETAAAIPSLSFRILVPREIAAIATPRIEAVSEYLSRQGVESHRISAAASGVEEVTLAISQ